MAEVIYNEWYGPLTRPLLAAIRKYNVSPSDYQDLENVYGNDYAGMTKAIKQYVYPPNSTQFSVFEFWNRRPM